MHGGARGRGWANTGLCPILARAIRGRRIRQPGSFRDWSTVPGTVLRSKVLLTALQHAHDPSGCCLRKM